MGEEIMKFKKIMFVSILLLAILTIVMKTSPMS